MEPDAHGLTIHITPLVIARAALEAVVLQVSQVYDQLVHALPAQASPPQLIASGAALLALQTLGLIPDPGQARHLPASPRASRRSTICSWQRARTGSTRMAGKEGKAAKKVNQLP